MKDRCKLKIKAPVPSPRVCRVCAGDRRRSGAVSVPVAVAVAVAAAVAEVMKGLNFYIGNIGNIVILSAYLNLRRSKEFGKIIPFLYLYLCLKGISTIDFSGVLKILTKMFTREDDQRESEISLPYRNPLMILKRPGLSHEPFGVIGIIGVIGDGHLGFRNALAKGGWHPQPKKALRAIFRRTDLCAEASRNSPRYASTGEILVFLANFFKPLIKEFPHPQPKHQACCVHIAFKTNLWESMTESFQLLSLALTPEIIIIHEIYLPPTKGEALKVFYKSSEIFEAKYPEETESTVLPLTTPLIFIYPVTVYMSQGRNFILILNLILTMTYNFSMLKGRVNPMKMIDSAKPLLIMIKSIITIVHEVLSHTALTSSLWRQKRSLLPHTTKTKRPSYPTLSSDCGALHGVPLSQRPSLHKLRQGDSVPHCSLASSVLCCCPTSGGILR